MSMRSYHQLVFEESVEGTESVYSNPQFDTLLSMTSRLEIMAITTQVSGTNPTLTVASQIGSDDRNWGDRLPTPEINGQALSTTGLSMFGGSCNDSDMTSGFARLKITLGGTSPKARVQIWATGRGEQVLR